MELKKQENTRGIGPALDFFTSYPDEAYNLFFLHHPQPAWLYSKGSHHFADVNMSAVEFYGFTKEEFLSMKVTDIITPAESSVAEQFNTSNVMAIGKKLWKHTKKNGQDFYAEVHTMPLNLASGVFVLDIINDKTAQVVEQLTDDERHIHELMLEKLNHSLERRAKELAASNEELEKFAYVASHDLQEPLRMVSSFLQLLRKKCYDQLDDKARDYINYAVDGAERMKRLILDLLEYSRVNSNSNDMAPVNLEDLLAEIQQTYAPRLQESGGIIMHEKLPVVKGNKTLLAQLFQNLISNALKYRGKQTPHIDIKVQENSTSYTLSVADNGIGIDNRFFDKIFVIFQRLHNRQEYSGTGIGLAICRKIIDKHGGSIWVESQPGEGSTFFFTLPKH